MHLTKLSPTTHDVGGIPVTRLLPRARHRTIGAWCFLDHAGPATFEASNPGMQVGAHPHTNLQTFTWMLAGEVLHRDSLGSVQRIRPGQVNLMTAGTGEQHGICHTEQTPEDVHDLHAVQLWIALPMNRQIEPSFHHYPELPHWSHDGVHYTLVTGTYQGHTAPTLQYSPLVGVDVRVDSMLQPDAAQPQSGGPAQPASSACARTLTLAPQPSFEYGVLVLKGSVTIDNATFGPDELAKLIPDGADPVHIHAAPGSHFMLLGGEPLPHPTLVWWNFIANTPQALQQAVTDWNSGHPRFGSIDLSGTQLTRLQAPQMPGSRIR